MNDHAPSKVVAYLVGHRSLATNATRDCFFLVEADGAYQLIDAEWATVLYGTRLSGTEAARIECELHSAMVARIFGPRAGQRQQPGRHDCRDPMNIKLRRLAARERELEAKLKELESLLEELENGLGQSGTWSSELDRKKGRRS